ncbi:MAG TPA: hypothetical protein DCQ33_06910, partial [Nitrospira sp.]|nr:hypothetical protein [Nitrospira sp.]
MGAAHALFPAGRSGADDRRAPGSGLDPLEPVARPGPDQLRAERRAAAASSRARGISGFRRKVSCQ